jgi:hypothetical protein
MTRQRCCPPGTRPRCDDCGQRARFAWRWPRFPGHGHLCFICRNFTAGGRPGAELLAIALPHHWHASTAGWLPA